jgi:hypothetical protein
MIGGRGQSISKPTTGAVTIFTMATMTTTTTISTSSRTRRHALR